MMSTIVSSEAAHFGAMAGDWWDPEGASAMLHKLNPVRLSYIRDMVDQHFGLDERALRPLEGKSALDVGCGAGLLAEPLARLGASVTAVDSLVARLARGGLLILSTPNRTGWSKLLTITLAEGFGRIPRGTHEYEKFIDPDAMRGLLAKAGLKVIDMEGIAYSPTRGLHLSEDLRLNYLVAAEHI
jgi:2-polyprenyl-6-hydroxyphenyl methylase/3-demethylubiquinone-9 3-methyltransferase